MFKRLGKSDLNISRLTFGGNVLGWTVNLENSYKLLDAFYEDGFNFIDTADVYSIWQNGSKGGESEKIIGQWLKKRGNRSSIHLATKVGGKMDQLNQGLSYKYIVKAVELSLKRLNIEYIDLYQSHYDDLNTPIEETLRAYETLIGTGKIRLIGASNIGNERLKASLEEAHKFDLPIYQSLQPEYNLYDREKYENEYEKICTDNNLGVLTYFSLAAGFLTGKYTKSADLNKSVRGNKVGKYFNHRGFKIISELSKIAELYNVKPAAIALAWILSRPSVTSAIVSITSLKQWNEIKYAVSLKIDQQHIDQLTEVSSY